ncbi:MAG TPA: hypothetical protein VMR90_10030 [Candidatus Cybelea sp.]|nr:hypothetical protein [Candidatus Cybelea sp.]
MACFDPCRKRVCCRRRDRWKLKTATLATLYVFHLARPWQRAYVIGAVIALCLNVFVLIAQFFMKISALKVLAPTQSEPSFLGTQVVVVLIFIVLGLVAAKRLPSEAVNTV